MPKDWLQWFDRLLPGPTKIFNLQLPCKRSPKSSSPSASQLIDYMTSLLLAKSINLTSHLDDRGEGLADKTIEAKATSEGHEAS